MKESRRAWVVCIGAFFAVFCTAGLVVSAFPVYLPYIRQAYAYSNTQTTTLLTIRMVMSLTGLFLIDWYHQKLGMRLGISLAVLASAVGMFLYAGAATYVGHCIASMACGIGNGLGSGVAASLLINRWFTKQKAFAIGIVSASTGLASVVAPIIIVPMIEQISLRFAFCVEGIFVEGCALLSFALIRDKDGAAEKKELTVTAEHRRANFLDLNLSRTMVILLAVGIFLSGFVMHGEPAVLPSLYEERYSTSQMSFLTALFGFALMAGRICYGRIVDKLGAYKANFIMFGLLLVGITGTCFANNYWVSIVFAFGMGLGSPISNVTVLVWVGDFSDPEKYARNVKWFNIAMTVAGLIAGTAVGAIADCFGSYTPTLLVIGILALITAVLVQMVYKADKDNRSR